MKFTLAATVLALAGSTFATLSCPAEKSVSLCCTNKDIQEAGKVAYYCSQPNAVFPCPADLYPFCCKTSSGPYPRGYTGEDCAAAEEKPPTQCKPVVKRMVVKKF